MKKVLFLSVAVMVASLTLAGCGTKTTSQKAAETIAENAIEAQTGAKVDINTGKGSVSIESQDGNKVDVDTNDGNVSVTSEDGQTEVSSQGEVKLSEGFPKELIVANDAKIIVSSVAGTDYSVIYTTDSEQASLQKKYVSEMTGSGWEKTLEINTGGSIMLSFSKDESAASITINANDDSEQAGQTMVSIVVGEN